VWYNPRSVNLQTLHFLFKQRMFDICMQDWSESIYNANSLSLYRQLKCSFEFESYLNNISRKFRTTLCRLRLASHKLRIETGRYTHTRTDRSLRVCEVCKNGDVEDEFHFVIVCPAYHMLRVKYIKPLYFNHPSVFIFIALMQSEKVATLKN
jgi:hypothetical protein